MLYARLAYRKTGHEGRISGKTPTRKPNPDATDYTERQARQRFRRRAAIEPRIGHRKSDFRLGRNFLRGVQGDALNLLLAATAANLSLWLRRASVCLDAFIAQLLSILNLDESLRPLSVQTGF